MKLNIPKQQQVNDFNVGDVVLAQSGSTYLVTEIEGSYSLICLGGRGRANGEFGSLQALQRSSSRFITQVFRAIDFELTLKLKSSIF